MMTEIIALFFAMLFRAQCEEMWYHNEATRLWKFFMWLGITPLKRWYKGHVSLVQAFWPNCPRWLRYNPALPLPLSPFTDDCWHHIKKLEFASLGAAFGLTAESWIVGIVVYLLLGVFFFVSFHAIVPSRYEGAWRPWRWLLRFWKPR